MTITLSDSFLTDLNELSNNNQIDLVTEEQNIGVGLEPFNSLQKSQRYKDIMQNIDDALLLKKFSECDENSQSIQDITTLLVDIEDEIILIYNFVRDSFRSRFPELESLIDHPVVYVRVVKKIGNEIDLNLVGLDEILPSHTVMSVLCSASTSIGKPLPEDGLCVTSEGCDRVIKLDSERKRIIDFVDSRMVSIAPNLSAVVGSGVAAKLVGTAGGLHALANNPDCNIMLLGAKKSNNLGGFAFSSQSRVGFIQETELYQNTPPHLRMFASHQLAAKSAMAARVDLVKGYPTGTYGKKLHNEICSNIEKKQEPKLARKSKPLPVPLDSSNQKKKRGGRRLRKAKERYGVTKMRKYANRMQFGVPEESSLGDGYGVGYGMRGQAGSGLLRSSHPPSKLAIKAAKKYRQNQSYGRSGTEVCSSLPSLAFTPVQGIELPNQEHQFHSGITQGH